MERPLRKETVIGYTDIWDRQKDLVYGKCQLNFVLRIWIKWLFHGELREEFIRFRFPSFRLIVFLNVCAVISVMNLTLFKCMFCLSNKFKAFNKLHH